MKEFRVQIRAYGYYADFKITAENGPISIEDAIVDKLGKNDIIWEDEGFYNRSRNYITYEEVTYDTRPIQTKKVLGVEVGTGASG